jgi:hypothetical protein
MTLTESAVLIKKMQIFCDHILLACITVAIHLKLCYSIPVSALHRNKVQYQSPFLSSECKENWFENQIDHFNWGPTPLNTTVWKQRYFTCDSAWKRSTNGDVSGPIFFYCGNEGPVEGYVNATGLMYETAPIFGAILIFAEHRYYGKSLPFGKDSIKYLTYLTHEQVHLVICKFLPSLTVRYAGACGLRFAYFPLASIS